MYKEAKHKLTGNQSQESVLPEEVDDRIDLIDTFMVLAKQKWFILLVTLIPVLTIGVILFLLPRDYEISYSYRMAMDEMDLKILEDKFYSAENIGKLVEDFKACGLEGRAREFAAARTEASLKKLVTFESLDPLFNTKAKDFEELQKRLEAYKTLLVMHIKEKSEANIQKVASIYRANFERVIPLYLEKRNVTQNMLDFKQTMAGIEESRYTLNLQLERKKTTLDKLNKLGNEISEKLPSGIILQFDNVSKNSDYLPLSYQIQATKTQIINLEEEIRTNKEKYDYYSDLLKLNQTLLDYLGNAVHSRFTLQQFHLFLTDTLAQYGQDTPHLQDYLRAYIKQIENDMTTTLPIIENPMVYTGPRGLLRGMGIVFVIAFVLSVFGAFLREGLRQKKHC